MCRINHVFTRKGDSMNRIALTLFLVMSNFLLGMCPRSQEDYFRNMAEGWFKCDWRQAYRERLVEVFVTRIADAQKRGCQLKPPRLFFKEDKFNTLIDEFITIAHSIELNELLQKINNESEKLVEGTTQDIKTFLWWFMTSLMRDDLYKKVSEEKMIQMLCVIGKNNPRTDYRLEPGQETAAQCIGRISDKKLTARVRHAINYGFDQKKSGP